MPSYTWSDIDAMEPDVEPSAAMLRDLAEKRVLPPVLTLTTNGHSEILVETLAASMNCIVEPPDPCGRCLACRDAFSDGGLSVIWLDGKAQSAATLRKLNARLLSQSAMSWQLVAVLRPHLIRGPAAKLAMETMLRKPPPATTFVLVNRIYSG